MKIKQFKKWQILELFWVDSMHYTGWKFEDDVENLTQSKYLLHSTVGYFVRQDKHQVVVGESKSADGEDKGNVSEVLSIPIVAIKRIREIK